MLILFLIPDFLCSNFRVQKHSGKVFFFNPCRDRGINATKTKGSPGKSSLDRKCVSKPNFLELTLRTIKQGLGRSGGWKTELSWQTFLKLHRKKGPNSYFERERLLLSCLRRDGLGEPEELLELELRDVLELPERLEADEELEPLLEPVLELDPELEVELDRDLEGQYQNRSCRSGVNKRLLMVN